MSADLLYRLNQCDERAFREVFDMWYGRVKGWLLNKGMVEQDELLQECISEGFMALWRVLHGKGVSSLGHARNIVFHRAIERRSNEYRSGWHKYMVLASVEEDEEDESYSEEDFNAALVTVRRAIADLPTCCRRIFEMWAFEDMGYVEIACEMDLSPQTVRNQKTRAIKLIRERLNIKVNQ